MITCTTLPASTEAWDLLTEEETLLTVDFRDALGKPGGTTEVIAEGGGMVENHRKITSFHRKMGNS